ncbi:DUF2800 domain-containing protein [Bradyrhizobium sp. HKCCYLS2038]|uniref:DUF2800 domain-containing protein n=1 Tax=Bradyrhizobium sp. HKCCYLS2038 TaxID=3420764 RepID=UPI003EC1149D
MSLHTDPNAQHAIYSPSSAHRWVNCTASAEAIARLPEQEEGEAAVEGTAAHEELERCLNDSVSVDPDHFAAYGVALAISFVRQLPPGTLWVEQRVALTDQIWGRCDVAHWHPETGVLTIVDLKNGVVGVDAEENEQLRIYAAASMFTHKLPVKWVRYAVVQPNDFRPVPRVKQWVEPVESLYAWAEKVAAIPRGPKSFVAGEQCTYCPLFGRCDASRDMLAQIGALVAGLMTADQVPPEQWALFMNCKKPIVDAFKNAEKAWQKIALVKGSAPEGTKIVKAEGNLTWTDPVAARALVVSKLGVDALDLPTATQAIERGIPEAEVKAIATRPDNGPVLALASDKRKPWAPRTAQEMFGPK